MGGTERDLDEELVGSPVGNRKERERVGTTGKNNQNSGDLGIEKRKGTRRGVATRKKGSKFH